MNIRSLFLTFSLIIKCRLLAVFCCVLDIADFPSFLIIHTELLAPHSYGSELRTRPAITSAMCWQRYFQGPFVFLSPSVDYYYTQRPKRPVLPLFLHFYHSLCIGFIRAPSPQPINSHRPCLKEPRLHSSPIKHHFLLWLSV